MARTWGELQLELAQRFPAKRIELLRTWLNDALDDILDRREWLSLRSSSSIATVVDTDIYDLPADLRAAVILSNPLLDPPAMPKVAMSELAPRDQAASGLPRRWAPWPDDTSTDPPTKRIKVRPIPSSIITLTLVYTRQVAPFLDGNESASPPAFIASGALLEGARMRALEDEKDYLGADRARTQMEQYINNMLQNDSQQRGAIQIETPDIASEHRRSAGEEYEEAAWPFD